MSCDVTMESQEVNTYLTTAAIEACNLQRTSDTILNQWTKGPFYC